MNVPTENHEKIRRRAAAVWLMCHTLIGERERCPLTFAQKWLADSVKVSEKIR